MDEIETIRRLVKVIQKLAGASKRDWVSWKEVSRHHTGSVEASVVLSSLAALPKWQELFAMTETRVKLSPVGIRLAAEIGLEQRLTSTVIADAVVAYAQELQPLVFQIKRIDLVAPVQRKFVHAIHVDLSDEVLPNETPVEVTFQNDRTVPGKLVGQEPDGDVLYIACDTDILPSQLPKNLIVDRSTLLGQLAIQLRSLSVFPSRMAAVFQPSPAPVIAHTNSVQVATSLIDRAPPWTQLLWGPPGAGKTFGLGHFVASSLKRSPQETVLIVAPSNRAVDVAVEQLRKALVASSSEETILSRRILRYGYPRSSEVLGIPELLGPLILDQLSKDAYRVAQQIRDIEQNLSGVSQTALLRANLLAIQEAIKTAVITHVAECAVVATTTTLAYMPGSPVAMRMWDTIIVDEVTMVPPAVCVFLASRARQRLLLAGDPCQLSPVYQSRADSVSSSAELWLKNDVFTTGGVSTGKLVPDAINVNDSRLARISAAL